MNFSIIPFKKIQPVLGIMALILVIFTGCDKYLSHEPDTRVVLSTPADIGRLLASAYPKADFQTFTEAASDNVADKGIDPIYIPTIENSDAFFFKENFESLEPGSPTYYWQACYGAIAAANQALDFIAKKGDSAIYYTSQKGEALLCRAYAHFQLVSLFSKSYDPATAATDMGIPYVDEPETIILKNYERKTVQYTYDRIEQDLLAGLPLLKNESYTIRKYHFNKDAANAFASRFYLFKQSYQKSLDYAHLVLGGANLYDFMSPSYFQLTRGITIQEALAAQNAASEPSRLLITEVKSNYGALYFLFKYGMDLQVQNRIFSDKNFTDHDWKVAFYTGGKENAALLRFFPYARRTSISSMVGENYTVIPLFTVEEVIFNRIESQIQLGNYDSALQLLNKYLDNRFIPDYDSDYAMVPFNVKASDILSFYNITDIKEGLIKATLFLKQAEFAQMGLRWFDILRYKLPLVHQSKDGYTQIKIGPDDPRKVFQIPITAKYSNLPKNPR